MNLLTLGVLLASSVSAAPALEFREPPSQALIGAPFEIEGTIRAPLDWDVSLDSAALEASAFSVLAWTAGPQRPDGDAAVRDVRLTLAAFEVGPQTLPPWPWKTKGPDGAEETAPTPPVKVEILAPPGADAQGDIRDIKPPVAAPWWLGAAALALLAALAWGAWRWSRSRRGTQAGPEGPAPDTRPPHVKAMDELEALYREELPVKEFYDRMSDILRAYFEGRFGIVALVLTTGDVVRQMRAAELDAPIVARAKELLETCDLVKFARLVPPTPEIRRDWETAVRIVRETEPKPPPEPASTPAAQGT